MSSKTSSKNSCEPPIETSIDGDFNGWEGETIYKLQDASTLATIFLSLPLSLRLLGSDPAPGFSEVIVWSEQTQRYLTALRALEHSRTMLEGLVNACYERNSIPPDLYTQMMAMVDEIKKTRERVGFEHEMRRRGIKIH